MLLKNQTNYKSADLRRFFFAGLRAKGASTSKHILVIYGRGLAHHGLATIGRGHEASWIRMSLPRDPTKLDILKIARVFEHEVDHNLGLGHRHMQNWWTLQPTWQEGLELRHQAKQKTVKVARNLRAEREARARKLLARAERKLAAAERLVKKWSKKVRYYEKTSEKIAAGGTKQKDA